MNQEIRDLAIKILLMKVDHNQVLQIKQGKQEPGYLHVMTPPDICVKLAQAMYEEFEKAGI